MVGNPFSHLLDSFEVKKIFFANTPLFTDFNVQTFKNIFFENGVKSIFSSFRFILSKKNYFSSIPLPWDFFGKNLILLLTRKKKKIEKNA